MNENLPKGYNNKMKRTFHLLCFHWILFMSPFFHAQAQQGMGCDFEDVDTSRIVKAEFSGHRGALPSSYSLKNFAPMPGNQGSVGSCASWSSAYGALTIINGVEHKGKQIAFSPWHLYNRVQTSLNRLPCQSGSTISSALNMLKSNGCLRFEEYSPNCASEPVTREEEYALYDYQTLSISVLDFKRALNANQPIVAAFKTYGNNAWENNENLIDGFWNGKISTVANGGHAMCIIGYDDSKNGGAFEVMNSWGTNWGAKGFFWIAYKDIGATIKNAFTLLPHPEELITSSPNVFGQQIEIHNDCFDPVYISITTQQEDEWISKGWYPVLSNDIFSLDISSRTSNELFWTAANHDLSVFWDNEESPNRFCVDLDHSFEYNDHHCDQPLGFYSAKPKEGQSKYILHVGCPTLQGRNSEVIQLADYTEIIEDSRPKDIANLQWVSPFSLFDLFTQKIIMPSLDDDGNIIYTVWVTDGISPAENKIYSVQELENDHRYKFGNANSAQNWVNWKSEQKK